jgi:hypothetical protein
MNQTIKLIFDTPAFCKRVPMAALYRGLGGE